VGLTTARIKVIGICVILAASVSGCDLIASIKEYFQGSNKEAVMQPASSSPEVTITQTMVSSEPAPSTAKPGNILARVGQWTITVDEFRERLDALKEVVPEYDTEDPEAQKLVLEELVNQQVLVADAERTGLARQKDIRSAVEEFRRTLIVRETARKLTQDIAVSEEEARAFYEENEEAMVGPAQWHVREIVVNSKGQATTLLSNLLAGTDFAATAQQYSIGDTAAQGGDLGFITQEPFPQMGNVLLAMEVGDVSSVFKGPKGYYIVKLEEKTGGESIAFEEIKDDIIQSQTLMKQQQTILDRLMNLKQEMKIEINDQLLPK
jgi:peptidyl-prolyl cis-trans isomerase C